MDKNEYDTISKRNIVLQECRAILAALHFLTIIPVNRKLLFTHQELGKSVAYYPIIGLLIGLFILGLNNLLINLFPSSVVSALIIVFWVGITGALHFDGLLDTCDGIFGGKNSEERLKIMKDERIGAFALIGGILIMLTKYVTLEAIIGINGQVLLLAPVISRWGMTAAIVGFPYAKNEGLGYTIKEFSNWKQAIFATIFTIVAAWLISRAIGLIVILLSGIVVLIISYSIIKKIPGLSGDNYGAINEIVEVWVLLAYAALAKL